MNGAKYIKDLSMISIKQLAYAVSLFCMIGLVGCHSGTSPDQTNLDSNANFEDRLGVAKAISNINQRDDALSKLALSAAQAGRLEIVRKALESIRVKATEDASRTECALAFANSTNLPDAFGIAENIKELTTRDTTMGKLAVMAGGVGDVHMIDRFLDKISQSESRDSAANKSAIALAQKGDIIMAKRIAEKIRSKEIQNQTLSQIAAGH